MLLAVEEPVVVPVERSMSIEYARRYAQYVGLRCQALSTLSRLLKQQKRPPNEVVIDQLTTWLRQFPTHGHWRDELVRTASFFLDSRDPPSFEREGMRLSRFGQRVHAGRADACGFLPACGTNDERYVALAHTMPRWLATVSHRDFDRMRCRLLPSLLNDPPRVAQLDIACWQFIAARDGREPLPAWGRLPRGVDWLARSRTRSSVIERYLVHVDEGGSNRYLASQLLDLASDMHVLGRRTSAFVGFLEELFEQDDSGDLVVSSDRRELLVSLLIQLRDPRLDTERTRAALLTLAQAQLESQVLTPPDRAQLAAALRLVVPDQRLGPITAGEEVVPPERETSVGFRLVAILHRTKRESMGMPCLRLP